MGKRMMKNVGGITLPVLSSVLHHTLEDDVYVDGRSFELLQEIQRALAVFEPIGDDEARMIWLDIPRGTAEEWKAFDDEHSWYSDPEDENLVRYQEALNNEYPYDKEWFFLVTSTCRENTFLKISDRNHRYVIFTNRHFRDEACPKDMVWIMEPLLRLVKVRVDEIVKNPNAYNRYIEENLPYRQRSGRIKSKVLNKILPERRLQVEDREHCIEVMKELIRREEIYESEKDDWESRGLPAPFEKMTIREFCKYYRVADRAFLSRSGNRAVSEEDDVAYYTRHGLHGQLDEYDLDSEKDFKRLATDHYGELGLSRMNVGATKYYAGGKWIITFGISYSAHDEVGLRIAMALYETGAPFVFYDAENLLHILEETGMVRISPFTFHDYLQGDDDEGVIEMPFVENCDKEGELTREQYDEIVRQAEWEPEVKLRLDKTIPLEDKVYDLIRDEAKEPMTLSEIRHRIEKKYETYLSVFEEDGYMGYYYVHHSWDKQHSPAKSENYYPTFNEAMRALILEMGKRQLEKSGEK